MEVSSAARAHVQFFFGGGMKGFLVCREEVFTRQKINEQFVFIVD